MATTTTTNNSNLEEENRLLKEKISQLIADNIELSSRLENDYDPSQPVRPLTLQEKLEINMGNELKKYRIERKDIKQIYGSIVYLEHEPEYIDLMFDNNRMFKSYHFVDMDKEIKEIEEGANLEVDVDKINEPSLQQKYDVEKVLNKITDIPPNEST